MIIHIKFPFQFIVFSFVILYTFQFGQTGKRKTKKKNKKKKKEKKKNKKKEIKSCFLVLFTAEVFSFSCSLSFVKYKRKRKEQTEQKKKKKKMRGRKNNKTKRNKANIYIQERKRKKKFFALSFSFIYRIVSKTRKRTTREKPEKVDPKLPHSIEESTDTIPRPKSRTYIPIELCDSLTKKSKNDFLHLLFKLIQKFKMSSFIK